MKSFFYILLSIIIFSLSSCPTSLSFDDISKMSSREMIENHTRNVRRAAVTVGIVQNGEMSFTVYGENGRVLPNREHIYEIGSITKPITAQLFARAIYENKVSLDDQIDRFLNLPAKAYYPTIRRILTHTSGYRTDYYWGIISSTNFALAGNLWYGLTRGMILDHIGKINLENRDYLWEYSNFGIGVAGLVLEKIYNEDFTSLMNNYLRNTLGLQNTRISDGKGDLSNYMTWSSGNPYIPAGAIVSTITDMMKYAQMQITGMPYYVSHSHKVEAQINNVIPELHIPELGLRIDAMGLAWFIDSVNNIIWHGGTMPQYHSYLGIDLENDIAVVVLSNIGDRIFAAQVIGAKILKELR